MVRQRTKGSEGANHAWDPGEKLTSRGPSCAVSQVSAVFKEQ